MKRLFLILALAITFIPNLSHAEKDTTWNAYLVAKKLFGKVENNLRFSFSQTNETINMCGADVTGLTFINLETSRIAPQMQDDGTVNFITAWTPVKTFAIPTDLIQGDELSDSKAQQISEQAMDLEVCFD